MSLKYLLKNYIFITNGGDLFFGSLVHTICKKARKQYYRNRSKGAYMKKILLSLISFVIGHLLVVFTFTRKDIILCITLIIFWFAVLVPVLSFQYSKRILKNVKRVWLYVLWHSLVIALSYLVFVITEGESYLYALIIFIWSGLWGALGAILGKNKKW